MNTNTMRPEGLWLLPGEGGWSVSTTLRQIVQAAIPGVTDEDCSHVLWGRTPYPMRPVTAREVFKAAYGLRRAWDKGNRLCEWCDRLANAGGWECDRCEAALREGG